MKRVSILIGMVLLVFVLSFYIRYNNQTDTKETQKSADASAKANSSFAVHFIDVGKGDSIFVTCDGLSMLIDAGKEEHASDVTDYIKALKIKKIDYIVSTHLHDDHIGGLSSVVAKFTIGKAFSNILTYDSTEFHNYTKELNEQGVKLSVPEIGSTIQLGSATVQFIGPVKSYTNENSESLVLRIEYGNTSFLFMGDAQSDSQLDMMNAGYTLSSTVIKVAHHGSVSANSDVFLRAVNPKYAVISVGDHYQYSILSDETLASLESVGTMVYRTDLYGNITCLSDGQKVTFTTEKEVETN